MREPGIYSPRQPALHKDYEEEHLKRNAVEGSNELLERLQRFHCIEEVRAQTK